MPEVIGPTRAVVEQIGKNATRIAQPMQESPEPAIKLCFAAQDKDQPGERLGRIAGSVGAPLKLNDVADTVPEATSDHEHPSEHALRTRRRVEPDPSRTGAIGRRVRPETQQLRRPVGVKLTPSAVPLNRFERQRTDKVTQGIPHAEQVVIIVAKGCSVNADLPDIGVRTRGVTGRVPGRLGSILAGMTTVTGRSGDILDAERTRIEDDEIRVVDLDMAGATTRGLIGRQLDRVSGSMATGERGTGLKDGRGTGGLRRIIALTHDDNRGAGRVRATGDTVRKEHTAASDPLTFDEKLGGAREPRTNLEWRTRRLPRRSVLVKLRVHFARGALRFGAMAYGGKKDRIAVNKGRKNLDGRAGRTGWMARLGQESVVRLRPSIGGQDARDLLRTPVAPAEELQAGDPEGAGRWKRKDNHRATEAKVIEPMPGRKTWNSTGGLEAALRRPEVHAEAPSRKGTRADHAAVLDDVARAILTKVGEAEADRTNRRKRGIWIQGTKEDLDQGLMSIARVPEHMPIPAHDVVAAKKVREPANMRRDRNLGVRHGSRKGEEKSILSTLFL